MLSYSLSKFSSTSPQTLEKSLNFVIPIAVLLCIGVVYIMSQRAEGNFCKFYFDWCCNNYNNLLGSGS